jgi:hypothetical protein
MSYAEWEREVLPLQRHESDFEVFVRTYERRIRLALCAAYTPRILQAFQEWMGETEHPAFALSVEFSRRGVVEDAQVGAAAQLEAVDEFLAQYEG